MDCVTLEFMEKTETQCLCYVSEKKKLFSCKKKIVL